MCRWRPSRAAAGGAGGVGALGEGAAAWAGDIGLVRKRGSLRGLLSCSPRLACVSGSPCPSPGCCVAVSLPQGALQLRVGAYGEGSLRGDPRLGGVAVALVVPPSCLLAALFRLALALVPRCPAPSTHTRDIAGPPRVGGFEQARRSMGCKRNGRGVVGALLCNHTRK